MDYISVKVLNEVDYMHKRIITACLLGCLFLTLLASNAADALAQFLLVGAIPGTSLNVPPTGMLLIYASAFIIALSLLNNTNPRRQTTKG